MLLMCPICLIEFKVKPFIYKKAKHPPCCSISCANIFRKHWTQGIGNHQWGLKGNKNKSFKTYETCMKRGTNKYIFVYEPWHPYAESTGRVRQHRYVVETNHLKFDDTYFHRVLDDTDSIRWVLKPKYDVHHKDCNTLNNEINNLEIVTRGEHTRIHNKLKGVPHDSKGRFTRVEA